jgi:outer membrane protein assembly factor BamA
MELRHASPATFSDTSLRFSKLLAERSQYWGVGDGAVVAFRVRTGVVFGGRSATTLDSFLRRSDCMRGANDVRGYPQNELGSAIYIARNIETRFPIPRESIRLSRFRAATGHFVEQCRLAVIPCLFPISSCA